MMFGSYISYSDFEACIRMILVNDFRNKNIMKADYPFIFISDTECLISKWMYSDNFDIVGDVKDICFNSSGNKHLGDAVNVFGKNTFEHVVQSEFRKYKWLTNEKGVKIKNGKQVITDIDLVAFKNGVLFLGQIKVAHCGYKLYQKWKTEKTIMKGIEQCHRAIQYVKQSPQNFYKLLKATGMDIIESSVKHIVPILICGSNHFSAVPNDYNVSVMGMEMLDELLFYDSYESNAEILLHVLESPLEHFAERLELPEIKYSQISTSDYTLLYQEIE